jgi:hypothetical protein
MAFSSYIPDIIKDGATTNIIVQLRPFFGTPKLKERFFVKISICPEFKTLDILCGRR